MAIVECLSYRDWQRRNKEKFQSLSREQQKEARERGYHNRGWKKVKCSWSIICKLALNVTSLFEYKLSQGDLIGAIDLSILEAERAKKMARTSLRELDENQKQLDRIADEALKKHLPL